MGFHDRRFDASTQLKLEIFRGYIQEWLPVFLSRKSRNAVRIYDFFCGPGTDLEGASGSPLVIEKELMAYLNDPGTPKAGGVDLSLYFNDAERTKVDALRERLRDQMDSRPFRVEYSSLSFREALEAQLPFLERRDTAALVLLDQCGVSQITESIFHTLIRCPTTDVLFFISSDNIRRFANEPPIRKYFPQLSADSIKLIPNTDVHRFICLEYYRKMIPNDVEYYVWPFSIKKDSSRNIYGLIFGSGSLFGLDKFLRVCWREDQITGEANYNIDGDYNWGQDSLPFEDYSSPRKLEAFKANLEEFLKGKKRTNKEIYRFTLEAGFLPTHANSHLTKLQQDGRLEVVKYGTGIKVRKGSFYLSWKNYDKASPAIEVRLEVTKP